MKLEITDKELDAITQQLQQVISTGNVQEYLENNINYEIDTSMYETPDPFAKQLFLSSSKYARIESSFEENSRFINWWQRSEWVSKVRKAICTVVNKIKELIDEAAELKKILEVALTAVAVAIGISINPVITTIVVGLLATMILKGVEAVCPVA